MKGQDMTPERLKETAIFFGQPGRGRELAVALELMEEVRRLQVENEGQAKCINNLAQSCIDLANSVVSEGRKTDQLKASLSTVTQDNVLLRAALEFYRNGYSGEFRCLRCKDEVPELQEKINANHWGYFGHYAKQALSSAEPQEIAGGDK